MKKVVALVVVAVALAWAAAFLDFEEPTASSTAAAADEQSEQAHPAHTASTRDQPTQSDGYQSERDEPASGEPLAMRNTTQADPRDPMDMDHPGNPSGEADDDEQDEREGPGYVRAMAAQQRREGSEGPTDQELAQLGERGQGTLSPDNDDLMRAYAAEPRDGDWAPGQEQDFIRLVNGSPYSPVQVHCRTTVCQVWFKASEADDFRRFLELDGVQAFTGADIDTPYSLRGPRMSFFFKPAK